MRSRLLLASAAVVALVPAVGACGSGDNADGSPTDGTQATTTRAAVTTAKGTAASQPATGSSTRPTATKAAQTLRLTRVASFNAPLYVTGAPGDTRRLFVVEQGGKIRVVRAGRTLRRPFLDISSRVTAGGEQGLLSVAFAPDYPSSGRFYVYYTDRDQQQRVVEYRRAGADRANASSARLVLKMADHEPNHNGGSLVFGPDGLLYIGTGDGGGADDQHGSRGNAQDLGSLLGKLLRIDPRQSGGRPYSIPAANPFAGRSGSVRKEIYSYGLRNPWRFSFDRDTGALTIGDVGQDTVEEIDHVAKGAGKGANFGWRPFEGTTRHTSGESAPGAIAPVLQFTHGGDGFCSITGGYIVRDKRLPASIQGQYVYGDYCEGHIRAARLSASGAATDDRRLSLPQLSQLSSFGQDTSGRVYAVSLDGPVYRLTAG
ncbi:MAG: glucose/sorbosone dehydrogenase-like protein [Solirubrobacterales bacterium]|nr:glucose/sorbosone dehydrogenase-like protein [Solirubrobacterales bacterium]